MVIIIEKTSSAGANFAYARGVLSASTRRDTRDFAQKSVLRTGSIGCKISLSYGRLWPRSVRRNKIGLHYPYLRNASQRRFFPIFNTYRCRKIPLFLNYSPSFSIAFVSPLSFLLFFFLIVLHIFRNRLLRLMLALNLWLLLRENFARPTAYIFQRLKLFIDGGINLARW